MKLTVFCFTLMCLIIKVFLIYERDIYNGYSSYTNNITDNEIKLNIKVNISRSVIVSLFTNYLDDISKNMKIILYNSEKSILSEYNQTIISIPFNNGYVFLISYNVTNPLTNSISFIFEIQKQIIEYLQIRSIIINGLYELNDGESKNITEVLGEGKYCFYLPIQKGQKVNINLITNCYYPYNSIRIYEIKNKNEYNLFVPYLQLQNLPKESAVNNQYITPFIYMVTNENDEIKYLRLEIDKYSNSNVQYLFIKILFDDENDSIDIINGKSNNIYNIQSQKEYYFYTNLYQFDIASIKLTNSYMDCSSPYNYVDIYEYSNKMDYLDNISKEIIFKEEKSLYQSVYATLSYNIRNYKTNLMAIKIKTNCSMKIINVKVDIQKGAYFLEKFPKTDIISNINSNFKYYLIIKLTKEKSLNITMKMSNLIENEPFNSINIFECDDNNLENYKVKTNLATSSQIEGDMKIIKFSYSISEKNIKYIYVELSPNYNIEFLNAMYESDYSNDDDESSNSHTGVILFVIFFIIIIIVSVGIFFIWKKKKEKENIKILNDTPSPIPLYSITEGQTNHVNKSLVSR